MKLSTVPHSLQGRLLVVHLHARLYICTPALQPVTHKVMTVFAVPTFTISQSVHKQNPNPGHWHQCNEFYAFFLTFEKPRFEAANRIGWICCALPKSNLIHCIIAHSPR